MKTREKLLSLLKEKKGKWVSGEFMRGELNVSRSAVSKHIQILKDEGYHIDASTNRGYLFKDTYDVLSLDEIYETLTTEKFGSDRIFYFAETDSTNIQARIMAQNDAVEGTVIIADSQTSGRGRKKREWYSSPRFGIYASLIVRPDIPPVNAPIITLITAVSVAKALIETTGADIEIKWPNDLLINGKKICGILTEIMTDIDTIDYIIIGIGINVNTLDFPDDIKEIATSIKKETGKGHKRAKIFASILNCFEKYYEQFIKNEIVPIMNQWRELCGILGKPVRVDLFTGSIEGIAKTVEDDGVLIVVDENGESHRVISGDVHHLRSIKGDTAF